MEWFGFVFPFLFLFQSTQVVYYTTRLICTPLDKYWTKANCHQNGCKPPKQLPYVNNFSESGPTKTNPKNARNVLMGGWARRALGWACRQLGEPAGSLRMCDAINGECDSVSATHRARREEDESNRDLEAGTHLGQLGRLGRVRGKRRDA